MGWFFPWDAAELVHSPPNTTSPGLGGAFLGCQPLAGKQSPFQSTRTASVRGSLGSIPPPAQVFLVGKPEQRRKASLHPGGRREGLPWSGSHRASACAARPTGTGCPEIPSFPPPDPLSAVCRGSPCPPSLPQLARLSHLKEKEKEGKKRSGREEGREKKPKSKGEAGLCQGWAAAKPSLSSSSASLQPPGRLGHRVRPARTPAWSRAPGQGMCTRVSACINKRELGRRRRGEAASPMRSGEPPTSSLHPLWRPFAEQNLRLKPGRQCHGGGGKAFKEEEKPKRLQGKGSFAAGCRLQEGRDEGPANGKQKEPGPARLSPP